LAGQDPLAHVAFHDEAWDPESRWLHTHGLQKFGRPELDLLAVPVSLGPEAMSFLREVAASLATGARLAAGGEIDMAELGLVLAVSVAQDLDHRAPFGRLRLVDAPQPGEVEPVRVTRLLTRMVVGSATSALDTGRLDEALADADRLLVADPEDCAALLLKARILLRAGRADEALDLGDFMRLRAPSDHRGPLAAGLALAALGRPREALHRLNEAIELDPESADAYATRAAVHDRLGEQRLGAVDRARAAYLADAGQ
jgi:tetratricopeptide (TPR) repeat protein